MKLDPVKNGVTDSFKQKLKEKFSCVVDEKESDELSEKVLKVAAPVIEQTNKYENEMKITALAIAAWNGTLLPENKCKEIIDELCNSEKYSDIDILIDTRQIIKLLMKRKLNVFPDDKRYINHYEIKLADGGMYLSVATNDMLRKLSDLDTDIVETYKKYREKQKKLNTKIINSKVINKNILKEAGKLLKLIGDNTIIIDSQEQEDLLFDFTINDYKKYNKTVIENYKDQYEPEDSMEQEIIEAMMTSYTSLFAVKDKRGHSLILQDLLNKKKEINLIDIALSESYTPNLLLFTRILQFEEFAMTGGVNFAFAKKEQNFLIRKQRSMIYGSNIDDKDMARYVVFHRLNKKQGRPIRFE